jgi:hypothetical protein
VSFEVNNNIVICLLSIWYNLYAIESRLFFLFHLFLLFSFNCHFSPFFYFHSSWFEFLQIAPTVRQAVLVVH